MRRNTWLPAFEAVKVLRSTFDDDLLHQCRNETLPYPRNNHFQTIKVESFHCWLNHLPCCHCHPSPVHHLSVFWWLLIPHTCPRSKASRMCHAGGRWGPHWCLKAKGIGCWHGHGPIGLWHSAKKNKTKTTVSAVQELHTTNLKGWMSKGDRTCFPLRKNEVLNEVELWNNLANYSTLPSALDCQVLLKIEENICNNCFNLSSYLSGRIVAPFLLWHSSSAIQRICNC